jgi:hypothetical protein
MLAFSENVLPFYGGMLLVGLSATLKRQSQAALAPIWGTQRWARGSGG